MASPYPNGEYPDSALLPGYDLLANRAGYAWVDLVTAAAGDGVTINIVDGYRSLSVQEQLYEELGPWSETNAGAARPGTSNHGHGLAVDVNRDPRAMSWLAQNAERFGWRATLANEPWHFEYQGEDGMSMSVDDGSGGSAVAGVGRDTYPRGGQLMRTEDGTFVLRYQIRPRVFIEYSVSDVQSLRNSGYRTRDAMTYEDVRENQFLVDYSLAGDAAELAELGGTPLRRAINEVLDEYYPPWHPARNNPEIIALIARVYATPGVGDDTVRAWIAQTEYGATITEARATWQNANPAERERMVEEQFGYLEDALWQMAGLRFDDAPEAVQAQIQRLAERVARGGVSITEAGRRIERIAASDPESPYSRATRQENINRGEFTANVENTIGSLRSAALSWGVQMSPESLARWANDIEMNTHSVEDYTEYLKDMAMTLYPTKSSREMATVDWATPWTSTLSRVLEVAEPDLSDPRIQQALQNGTTAFEFERQLMQDPAWQETENARRTYERTFADISRQMGFS